MDSKVPSIHNGKESLLNLTSLYLTNLLLKPSKPMIIKKEQLEYKSIAGVEHKSRQDRSKHETTWRIFVNYMMV